MNDSMREKLLKMALVAFGAIFFVVYPFGLVWPSGWVWHGGEGTYYFQMICLLSDDLWGLCAPGRLPDRCGSETLGASEPDLVRHLVERRPCRHHGGTVRL